MYLHIGGETLIPLKNIIMIINLECSEPTSSMKDFFDLAKAEKKVKGCDHKAAKACIITREAVYFSGISAHTLWRRGLDRSLYIAIK